jgi:hypothetical protein
MRMQLTAQIVEPEFNAERVTHVLTNLRERSSQMAAHEDIVYVAHKLGKQIYDVHSLVPWLNKHIAKRVAMQPSAPLALGDNVTTQQLIASMQHDFIIVRDESSMTHLVREFNAHYPFPAMPTRDQRARSAQAQPAQPAMSTMAGVPTMLASPAFMNNRAQPRKRDGWCECCLVRYTDLAAHLASPQHRNFSESASGYEEIDAYLNALPIGFVHS